MYEKMQGLDEVMLIVHDFIQVQAAQQVKSEPHHEDSQQNKSCSCIDGRGFENVHDIVEVVHDHSCGSLLFDV